MKNGSITPAEAKAAYGKSESATWRYLGILTGTGFIGCDGNTNQVRYKWR